MQHKSGDSPYIRSAWRTRPTSPRTQHCSYVHTVTFLVDVPITYIYTTLPPPPLLPLPPHYPSPDTPTHTHTLDTPPHTPLLVLYPHVSQPIRAQVPSIVANDRREIARVTLVCRVRPWRKVCSFSIGAGIIYLQNSTFGNIQNSFILVKDSLLKIKGFH